VPRSIFRFCEPPQISILRNHSLTEQYEATCRNVKKIPRDSSLWRI
jgi:hypothetical protein